MSDKRGSEPILNRIHHEIERGRAAQAEGNEGMARVCARRAAGWAAADFLERKGVNLAHRSTLDQMHVLRDSKLVSDKVREMLRHLTQPLEKDDPESESYWPLDVDLLDEAEALVGELFGDN